MSLSTLIRGDDWKFTGVILNPADSTPINIAGGAAWVTLKSNRNRVDAAAEFQVKDLNIQDASDPENNVAAGTVVLRAAHDGGATAPPNSTLVIPGPYYYDFQYKAPSGEITTIESGIVTVEDQVTGAV